MGYPGRADEARILAEYGLPGRARGSMAVETLPGGALAAARAELASVHLSDALVGYVLDIVAATRQTSSIALGLSSRAAIALARCARIEAALRGGDFVVPDDVKRVAPWVIPHRLVLAPDAVLEGASARTEIERILAAVAVPRDTK
jgi:MoxR-like ATPase